MQLGIRAHDVKYGPLDELIPRIKEQGFSCMHIALSKSIKEFTPTPASMTPGLATYIRRLCDENHLDIAVLGNYLNLAHPDPDKLKEITAKYVAHMRFASILRPSVVGTETGAVNADYKYEPANHDRESLDIFIRNVKPVVEAAEKFGVIMAIEPVWKHIVYGPEQARYVLDEVGSPNLQIIFDPVNMLYPGNIDRQDEIINKTFDLLKDDIAVVHMKDFELSGDDLKSIPAGMGGLNYELLLSKIKEYKPYVQCTLENTSPDNAVYTREYIQGLYDRI
ncbi:MAG: sugar phosphate isomerase/epimerase [Lachnospiraceae bacterium]|nr:sugar phosphate isomerase/epimerase [Lachnospiraceae bacterium]